MASDGPRARGVTKARLQEELASLRARLADAEDMLRAISQDEVDALVVTTRRRGAEEVLTIEGAHLPYQLFVDTMQDGALTVSDDGTILHANRSFANLCGVEQPAGTPLQAYVADEEGLRMVLQNATESPLSLATTVRRQDGTHVPAEIMATALPLPGVRRIALVVSKGSARRPRTPASAPSLRTSAGSVRVESILAQIPTGILLVDARSGVVSYANRRAEQILGRVLAGLERPLAHVELTCWRADGSIVEPDALPSARVLRGEPAVYGEELARERGDGAIVHTRTSAAPVYDDEGNLESVIVAFEDITDQVLVRADLVANQRFRELFIAVLGHDLRDPLAAILSGAHMLLEKGGLDEAQLRVLKRVGNSARRLARMTDEVVDFTRSRLGGGIVLKRAPTALDEVVRAAAADLETSSPGRAIELSLEGELRGEWDADRLAQVVWNLLGNAVAHGDPARPVRVTARGDGPSVRLDVHNHGEPIPPALLSAIFDPFRRAEVSGGKRGLGLGLYIAQQIVHAHGGTLTVDSARERGTTFAMVLPRALR